MFGVPGWLDGPVLLYLNPDLAIEIPIGRPDSFWDERDLRDYDGLLFETLPKILGQLRAPVTMVDGGADIGLFSLKSLAAGMTVSEMKIDKIEFNVKLDDATFKIK